jgi:folate-dependent phosphoribosylglycinamide formyltransferase PurN
LGLRVLLTAGFDGARHAVALAEILRRKDYRVDPVIVVNPLTLPRVMETVRKRGFAGLRQQAMRLFRSGVPRARSAGLDAMEHYLRENNVHERSLKQWCRRNGSTYCRVKSLNDSASIRIAADAAVDGMIYAGGGILQDGMIEAVRGRIMNAHSGPLPQIRGMNACEWSLLLGVSPAVTIHFIDRGIDTGEKIAVLPLTVEADDTIEKLRDKCTVLGVKGIAEHVDALTRAGGLKGGSTEADSHRQCYTMAPALRELLLARLRSGRVPGRAGSDRR